MINYAHCDIVMIGAFIALIAIIALGLTAAAGLPVLLLALLLVLAIAMIITSVYNWTVERVAYRPLRGSFRLAPLISAIGMSIVLQEFVRMNQGARPKPMPRLIIGNLSLVEGRGEHGGFGVVGC